MAQLTFRAVLIGSCLGPTSTFLKAGWGFGVAITGQRLVLCDWTSLLKIALARMPKTILENNCMQLTAGHPCGVARIGKLRKSRGRLGNDIDHWRDCFRLIQSVDLFVRGNKELAHDQRLLLASELVAPRVRAFVDFLVVLGEHPEAAGVRCPGAYRVHDPR
jgi:hypothetical protein